MIANASSVACAIVDDMNVGVFAVDAEANVIAWNRFMELHSGRSAAEIVGQNLFACFPELPRAWLEGKLSRVRVIGNSSFVSWRQRPYLFAFPHNRPVTGGVTHMQQDCTFFPVRDEAGATR
jgi:PAS domain-containing protein